MGCMSQSEKLYRKWRETVERVTERSVRRRVHTPASIAADDRRIRRAKERFERALAAERAGRSVGGRVGR